MTRKARVALPALFVLAACGEIVSAPAPSPAPTGVRSPPSEGATPADPNSTPADPNGVDAAVVTPAPPVLTPNGCSYGGPPLAQGLFASAMCLASNPRMGGATLDGDQLYYGVGANLSGYGPPGCAAVDRTGLHPGQVACFESDVDPHPLAAAGALYTIRQTANATEILSRPIGGLDATPSTVVLHLDGPPPVPEVPEGVKIVSFVVALESLGDLQTETILVASVHDGRPGEHDRLIAVKNGGAPTVLALAPAGLLTLRSQTLLWAGGGTLFSLPLTGGTATALASPALSTHLGIVGSDVYFLRTTTGAFSALMHVPIAGGSVEAGGAPPLENGDLVSDDRGNLAALSQSRSAAGMLTYEARFYAGSGFGGSGTFRGDSIHLVGIEEGPSIVLEAWGTARFPAADVASTYLVGTLIPVR